MKIEHSYRHATGVTVVHVSRFHDDRGFFTELFNAEDFAREGLPTQFVQHNLSRSRAGVVRGLHFQWEPPMGKLMRVARGSAYLVAVDLRRDSETLGQHYGRVLAAVDNALVWAPASFARGFQALEDDTEIEYLTTGVYNAAAESGMLWNDPSLSIPWPEPEKAVVSDKDAAAQTFHQWLERLESTNFHVGDAR